MKTEHTPQALRLKEFIHLTGMSLNEFSRQCQFKSPRTITNIYTNGASPSDKALSKVVDRFPQLNYDWVLMGVGEMINKGFEKNQSTASADKSRKSGFQQIQKKLASHDLNLNELSIDLEKMIKTSETNMLVYTQTNAMLMNKIEELSNNQKTQFELFEQLIRKASIDTVETATAMSTKFFQQYEENIKKADDLVNESHKRLIVELNNIEIERRKFIEQRYEKNEKLITDLDQERVKTSVSLMSGLEKRQEQQEQENRDLINRLDQERKKRNDKHATDLKKEIKSLFEKNIQAQKNRMDEDLKHHEQDFQKLLDKLDDKIEKAITKITNKSDLNTKKALDFVEGLGKHTKHSSPKHLK